MENYDELFELSEETVASWLDGTISFEEEAYFENMLSSDFQLGEILDAYEDIEADYETLIEEGYELPNELSFDFQLPSVDFLDEIESNISHFDPHFEYSQDLDTSDNKEDDNNFDSDQYMDPSVETSMEDFNFF